MNTASRLALAVAAGLPATVFGQTITGLGLLPSGGTTSNAYSLSSDGLVAAGIAGTATGDRAFRWTSATGMVSLGVLSGGAASAAFAINANGTIAAGNSDSTSGYRAYRWTSGGMVSLDVLPGGTYSYANGVSVDGSVVVGYGNTTGGPRAFRWTSGTGLVSLGSLPGSPTQSVARGVSSDGSVVVGFSGPPQGFRAFRWTDGPGMQDLGTIPGYSVSYAFDVSADGAVVVGNVYEIGNDSGPAFRWTAADGMVSLGTIGGSQSFAYAVNGDGSRIVGSGKISPSLFHATLWTQATGMVDLNDHLPTVGVDLTGWSLFEANAITPDGAAFAGMGTHNGHEEAWIVRLPGATCYANCDHSTATPALNALDFGCFLQKFGAGDSYANCDGSTTPPVLNALDFGCFLQKYAAGCPR